MTDAVIPLRVPAATKARWVRESRAAGMRLTDWIIQKVEATMAIDLTNGATETSTWYAVVYQSPTGRPEADVQRSAPTWTNDYHVVRTPAWYPGTEDEWKRRLASQVISALAAKTP
ncbi:MAG TPA: hypothetical protein VFM22_00510 [Castellaniella sp.]|nr:hypothetical protein [Castellaniella sp.]